MFQTSQPTTVNTKGQVTIPVDIRNRLGIVPGSRVQIQIDEKSKKIVMEPIMGVDDLMGFFKTGKKYNKKQAVDAYVKDIVHDFVQKRKQEK